MGNMSKKVFITGCAKTGTTLLLRMCFAFEDCEVLYKEGFNGHEISLDNFVEYESKQKYLIGKRFPPSLLSNVYQEGFLQQKDQIVKNDIGIINIVRDGRDVVLSDGGYVKPERWISTMQQREQFHDLIDLELSYHDIVTRPDEVQKKIMETYGIEKNYDFSSYPDYVGDWVYDWNISVQGRKGVKTSTDYGKRKLRLTKKKKTDIYREKCSSEEQVVLFDRYLEEFRETI
tara:strand:- start:5042 stop:5734 length:693 start_codon:yes stop_codon:yes gene_type:complete